MPRPNLKRWLLKNFWGGQGQGRDRPSNGKWYLPFCSLYFFFLERETHKANINWIFKEFLIPGLIHVNVNIGDISYLSFAFLLYAHFRYIFYNHFIAISFFFLPTQKSLSRNVWNVSKIERKKIHIFYLLSWSNVYTYLRSWLYFRMKRKNGRFLTDFPKSRSFPKSWSERNIYVHRFKFDGSKGDAVNSKKQTSRAW